MILILFIICLNFFCLLFLILFKFPSGMKRDIFSQSIFVLIFGLHDLNIRLQMVVLNCSIWNLAHLTCYLYVKSGLRLYIILDF